MHSLLWSVLAVVGLVQSFSIERITSNQVSNNRREFLASAFAGSTAALVTTWTPSPALATPASSQDSLDVQNYLRTGIDPAGPMGVSGQAGKSRPVTGVVFRDGSDVNQDASGQVLAEILTGTRIDPKAVLVSFECPWKLEKGSVFDVECRDARNGDSVFLAVTRSTGGKALEELPSSFFTERLFENTGRFSFYGPPTDIKIKKSRMDGNRRLIEFSFSNLSQSTNAEIPRKALLSAIIPEGTDNAVMLVGSASNSQWKKGSETTIRETLDSFRAIPAPKSNLKLRPKVRGNEIIDF